MNGKQRKYNQVEINDLIDDAVNNAIKRRGAKDSQDDFLTLSDEEATGVAGGLQATVHGVIINPNPNPPIIHGVIINPNPNPPLINGIIIKPKPTPPKLWPIIEWDSNS